jgi:quercetin dioxygenase-like cupin family protein
MESVTSGTRAVLLAAILGIVPVSVQDPVVAPAYSVKLEFENDQIRVLRVHYPAHAKSPLHSHPGRAVVAVTASHLRVTTSDGNSREVQRHAGEVYWGDPVTHSAENLTDTPLETIEVEVKKAEAPAVAVPAKTENTSKIPLKEPVPVEMEPHHHVVLQNQYVRVLDVLFPPGDPSLFHAHSNDNVSIALSGDKTHAQLMGGDWGASTAVVPGQVAFHKAQGQPYTHRVGSAGTQPFHVIDVEIFP